MADADNATCIQCRELKPKASFRVRRCKGRRDYVSGKCRECEASYHRARVKVKKQSSAWVHARWGINLKSKYGITKPQYIDMMLRQDFCCAICVEPQTGWVVDHDHSCCNREGSCGSCVRALLCDNCNKMLGHARDSSVILSLGATYLEVHSGKNS